MIRHCNCVWRWLVHTNIFLEFQICSSSLCILSELSTFFKWTYTLVDSPKGVKLKVMPRLSTYHINEAIGMLRGVQTVRNVVRQFNVHPSSIDRIQQRYNTKNVLSWPLSLLYIYRHDQATKLRHLVDRLRSMYRTAQDTSVQQNLKHTVCVI